MVTIFLLCLEAEVIGKGFDAPWFAYLFTAWLDIVLFAVLRR